MAIEAFLVLALYPEVKSIRGMGITQFFLLSVLILFIADYIVTGHYPAPWNHDTPVAPPSSYELNLEILGALVALAGALIVHCAAIKFESRQTVSETI